MSDGESAAWVLKLLQLVLQGGRGMLRMMLTMCWWWWWGYVASVVLYWKSVVYYGECAVWMDVGFVLRLVLQGGRSVLQEGLCSEGRILGGSEVFVVSCRMCVA